MTIESTVHASFAAIEKGAALVYHKILATGVEITAWEASDPVVGAMVQNGIDYATAALTRFGMPVATIEIVADDLLAALKSLAALDATVPSVTFTATVVPLAVPVEPITAAIPVPAAAA